MTDEQFNKDRRFVMYGDMSNIKQYVLDKKDDERFYSKWTLMGKLNELAEENEELKLQMLNMEEDNDYFKSKASSLEEGYIKLQDQEIRLKKENEQLKKQIEELKDDLKWAKIDGAIDRMAQRPIRW